MDMIFRKMELDDIAQIVAIEEASFSTPWTADAFHRELTMNEPAPYGVLEKDGRVIGYCGLWIINDESKIYKYSYFARIQRSKARGCFIKRSYFRSENSRRKNDDT